MAGKVIDAYQKYKDSVERENQRKLQNLGVCVAGYDWIREPGSGGYRCAGGSHFVRKEDLETGVREWW